MREKEQVSQLVGQPLLSEQPVYNTMDLAQIHALVVNDVRNELAQQKS